MTLDGHYDATLDRVEDGVGVLLVEDGGDVVAERHVDPDDLPDDAGEGAVLAATFEEGTLAALSLQPEETERRREELQSQFDRLAERPPSDDGDDAA